VFLEHLSDKLADYAGPLFFFPKNYCITVSLSVIYKQNIL
jgi:hypothetical protein